MYNAHDMGTTMARSLWYNFPGDAQAAHVDYQFMLRSAVLVSPVVTEGAVSVDAYSSSDFYHLTKIARK
jgi:alpha-glucosidase (family GH31 glycosyl hydrolase)